MCAFVYFFGGTTGQPHSIHCSITISQFKTAITGVFSSNFQTHNGYVLGAMGELLHFGEMHRSSTQKD